MVEGPPLLGRRWQSLRHLAQIPPATLGWRGESLNDRGRHKDRTPCFRHGNHHDCLAERSAWDHMAVVPARHRPQDYYAGVSQPFHERLAETGFWGLLRAPSVWGRVYVHWGGTNGTPLHFHAQGDRHRMVPATLCMEMHYVSFVHGERCCSQQHRPQ